MAAEKTRSERQWSADVRAGIGRRFVQVFLLILFQAAILFLSSWRLDWWPAWLYVGIYLVVILTNAGFMLRYSPETIATRSESRDMKDWDKVVGGLFGVMYFVGIQLVAGLDARFGWTGTVSLAVQLAAILPYVLGHALFGWAMISNAFFATVVRVQKDAGHAVCTTGPYRFVRHPGYIGAILQSLAAPLMLGSLWALIPAGLAMLLIVVRTALEDRTLQEELDGYRDYAGQVRHRLLPGIW